MNEWISIKDRYIFLKGIQCSTKKVSCDFSINLFLQKLFKVRTEKKYNFGFLALDLIFFNCLKNLTIYIKKICYFLNKINEIFQNS